LLAAFILPLFSTAAIKEKRAPVGSVITAPTAAPTVVIDPGHGGTDRGARGKTPFCEEKRVCLQTARLVKKYLDQLGYHVVMTRNTDAFIPLSKRVEIASQSGSSAFVSIHYNSSRNPIAQGIEIFFYDSKEDRTRSIASKKLADAILPRLIRRTAAQSRGVKKGNFYVIRETTMPAILVEGGFISNPQERSLLKDRAYQEKIARGIADGIDQYFKARWRAASR
jgi:N-acetylmuramoyl-L-alanine amidase